MIKILCIAAVVVLAVLGAVVVAAVVLAVALGDAQDEIDNMKLDQDRL